jgi:hypothetical protein
MISISQPQDPSSFNANPDYACVMEPVAEIMLESERYIVDAETWEIIGTHRSIPCPGITGSDGDQGSIMNFDDFEVGRIRHELWMREIGKKK